MGFVSIVGAGSAHQDLITVRGLSCLQRAAAVVYDDLLADQLLDMARSDAELYYVGKRSGMHSMGQTKINALLIELAKQGKDVCRLKGGDPFVFGRGGEEALALRAAGVPFQVVPGVSSCIAVPELAGIPVTHRGLSRSFHIVTAHTTDTPDYLPQDFGRLACLDGTLVFLMGLEQLETILDRLIAGGKPADTPAAVVGDRTVRGTLADLARRAQDFIGPAVIVVGPVAALNLCDRAVLLLDGVTVGLTGTAQLRLKLQSELSRFGATIFCVQQSRLEAACTAEELISRLKQLWNWVAFTSPNGVAVFFDLLQEGKYDLRLLAGIKFAVVGPGTADALEQHGFFPDLIPERHDTMSLGDALAKTCTGNKVLLVGAENASLAPETMLRTAGIPCCRQTLYRLVSGPLRDRKVDYLVFGSAGGVENYYQSGGLLRDRTVVCIGAVTAQKASALGARRILTAADASAQALVAAILKDCKGATE